MISSHATSKFGSPIFEKLWKLVLGCINAILINYTYFSIVKELTEIYNNVLHSTDLFSGARSIRDKW